LWAAQKLINLAMEKIEYFRNSFYKIVSRPVPDQFQISSRFFGKNIWNNLRSHPVSPSSTESLTA
jgi:hypothetical protein